MKCNKATYFSIKALQLNTLKGLIEELRGNITFKTQPTDFFIVAKLSLNLNQIFGLGESLTPKLMLPTTA